MFTVFLKIFCFTYRISNHHKGVETLKLTRLYRIRTYHKNSTMKPWSDTGSHGWKPSQKVVSFFSASLQCVSGANLSMQVIRKTWAKTKAVWVSFQPSWSKQFTGTAKEYKKLINLLDLRKRVICVTSSDRPGIRNNGVVREDCCSMTGMPSLKRNGHDKFCLCMRHATKSDDVIVLAIQITFFQQIQCVEIYRYRMLYCSLKLTVGIHVKM